MPEYIVRLSGSYAECKDELYKLGVVTYKSRIIDDLIGFDTALSKEDLIKLDYIDTVECPTFGSF